LLKTLHLNGDDFLKFENINPADIEKRSMEIIESEADFSGFSEPERLILKRIIHTTADFDYIKNIRFSENAVEAGLNSLKNNAVIITDTKMILSGISKPALKALGCEAYCFVSDSDVIAEAKKLNTTRSIVSVYKAVREFKDRNIIFAVGNAPTALIILHELIKSGKVNPSLIIGVPVGFVNVTASKQLIMSLENIPYIVSEGRKGGSTVAVSICNALLYQLYNRNTGEIIS